MTRSGVQVRSHSVSYNDLRTIEDDELSTVVNLADLMNKNEERHTERRDEREEHAHYL